MEDLRTDELKIVDFIDRFNRDIYGEVLEITTILKDLADSKTQIRDHCREKLINKGLKLVSREFNTRAIKSYSKKSLELRKSHRVWDTVKLTFIDIWRSKIYCPLIRNNKPSPILYRRFLEWCGSCRIHNLETRPYITDIELVRFLASARHQKEISFYPFTSYLDKGSAKSLTSKTLDFTNSKLTALTFLEDLDSVYDTVGFLQQQEPWLKTLVDSPISCNLSKIAFKLRSRGDDEIMLRPKLKAIFGGRSQIFENLNNLTYSIKDIKDDHFIIEFTISRE